MNVFCSQVKFPAKKEYEKLCACSSSERSIEVIIVKTKYGTHFKVFPCFHVQWNRQVIRFLNTLGQIEKRTDRLFLNIQNEVLKSQKKLSPKRKNGLSL